MIKDKIMRLMGLARRQGALLWGAELCAKEAGRRQDGLLILASDAGRSTGSRFHSLAEKQGLSLLEIYRRKDLAVLSGRESQAVGFLTEKHLAAEIQHLLSKIHSGLSVHVAPVEGDEKGQKHNSGANADLAGESVYNS